VTRAVSDGRLRGNIILEAVVLEREQRSRQAVRLFRLRCTECGYGVSARAAPDRCPMCGAGTWELEPGQGRPRRERDDMADAPLARDERRSAG
jgi:rubrerythrin